MAAGPVSTPPKAAAAKAPAKSVPSPLASYGLTPGQLRQMVSAEVASQLAPQRQALTQAQQATDNQYGQARNALQNLTTGYAQLLAPISGQVRSTYDNAANSIADYAKGFSGVLQQNLNQGNAADQAILGVAGAPASQQAEVAGHLQAPVDALYGMRGALPAGALQNAGAAFTSAAELLPGMAVARGQQNALALTGEQGKADQTYRQDLEKLLASVPTLRTNAENNILKNARSDLATQILLQKFGYQQRSAIGNLTGIDPATGQPTYRARAAAEARAAKIAAAKAAAQAKVEAVHQKAVSKRNASTRSLMTKLSTWVYQQRHKQGNVVVGHEPIKQTVSTPNGSITEFFVNGQWVPAATPPPGAATKPVYAKGDVPANYNSMKIYLTRTLTQGLSGYGYTPADIANFVEQLLGPPPPAAPAPSPAPSYATHPRP